MHVCNHKSIFITLYNKNYKSVSAHFEAIHFRFACLVFVVVMLLPELCIITLSIDNELFILLNCKCRALNVTLCGR